jgi:ribosome production factor 2
MISSESPAFIEEKNKLKKRKPRIDRLLKKKEPLLVENTKKVLILKGNNTSQVISDVLTDISRLMKPNAKVMSRKNEIFPFEDVTSIEFMGQKNDCSLFAFGSHSKKRPNNLIIGRLYDGHLLDMIVFGVDTYLTINSFKGGSKKTMGSKPMFVFQGDLWDVDSTYMRIQNLLLDFFRGDKISKVSLKGLDHVISCSVVDGKIYMRAYMVQLKKSGTKIPNVSLYPMGPFIDLSVRRHQFASDDLFKLACKTPKILTTKKVKNISASSLGDKLGRIHMKKQDLDNMGTRRVSALRNNKKRSHSADDIDYMKNKRTKRKEF